MKKELFFFLIWLPLFFVAMENEKKQLLGLPEIIKRREKNKETRRNVGTLSPVLSKKNIKPVSNRKLNRVVLLKEFVKKKKKRDDQSR